MIISALSAELSWGVMKMRLIDADDFLYWYCRDCHWHCSIQAPHCDAIKEFQRYVMMHEVNAVLVKHGRWTECWRDPVRHVISVICSACEGASLAYLPKKDLAIDDVPKKICIQMQYCPKCGAKMCGGDADETT